MGYRVRQALRCRGGATALFVGLVAVGCGHAAPDADNTSAIGSGAGGNDEQVGGWGAASSRKAIPHDDQVPSLEAASRFLTRASFGPTLVEIVKLQNLGYTAWLDEQYDEVPSLSRPQLSDQADAGNPVHQIHRQEEWWANALEGEDQLRQRVAWALSQILVISQNDADLSGDPVGMAEYYDILVRQSFGNYRDLIEAVTLNSAMGAYLSMLKNDKPDLANNILPDENFAREVLQLFSIGLDQLNLDGTPILDPQGKPIPTYDQSVIVALAHAFTGWNYANGQSWDFAKINFLPMESWPTHHDQSTKLIFDGIVIPGGMSPEDDLAAALDAIFYHPNVGPFLGKQLIQRLVTSNPSPGYVQRVASVFNDNGQGLRGDLWAVVKAILMDSEARGGYANDPENFGKLKEPIIRLSGLLRAFDAQVGTGKFTLPLLTDGYAQEPLAATSVFNFYSPNFSPPGEVANAGLVAPEFEITTHSLIAIIQNSLHTRIYFNHLDDGFTDDNDILIDLGPLASIAASPGVLVDVLGLVLMGGQMSSELRDIVVDHISTLDLEDGGFERAEDALFLVYTSPQAVIQK